MSGSIGAISPTPFQIIPPAVQIPPRHGASGSEETTESPSAKATEAASPHKMDIKA
jgi:hypothetical protein